MPSLKNILQSCGCLRLHSGVLSAIFLTVLVTNAEAAAPDPQRGKLLYENHCTGCHESMVHIRETHRAKSFHDIQIQTMRWSLDTGLEWEASDINDVSWYLYNTYYTR